MDEVSTQEYITAFLTTVLAVVFVVGWGHFVWQEVKPVRMKGKEPMKNIRFGNERDTSRELYAYGIAINTGLVTKDDCDVLVVLFRSSKLCHLMVTEVDGLKVIHDKHDSVIRRKGKIRVAQVTDNADEFIYKGRGMIEADW
jgi:hypothetical protein